MGGACGAREGRPGGSEERLMPGSVQRIRGTRSSALRDPSTGRRPTTLVRLCPFRGPAAFSANGKHPPPPQAAAPPGCRPHVTYCASHHPRRTQAPPHDVTQSSDRLYLPLLSAFANWLDQETAPPPSTRPRSPGERGWGRGLNQRGGVRRLRAGKGAAWSAVGSFSGHTPHIPLDLPPAPPPPTAVTRETGRDRPTTRSWFHGSREESSFGATGGGSGPGHQLDALFGEPRVTFEE